MPTSVANDVFPCCGDRAVAVISALDQFDCDQAMNGDKGFVDAYFRFLNLVGAIQQLPSVPRLDPAELRLLEFVAGAWHAGRSLSVTEAMSLETAGAPATIHRRLTRLRHKGLIELHANGDDSRVKSIVPTEQAQDYFREVARCLHKVSQS